jgi:hypothetical protein
VAPAGAKNGAIVVDQLGQNVPEVGTEGMFLGDGIASGSANQDRVGRLDVPPPEVGSFGNIDEVEVINVHQASFDEGPSFLHQAFPMISDLEEYKSQSIS